MQGASARGKKAGTKIRAAKKVSKTYRLTPSKLAAAQRILGTSTATEAIETALDMVVFRQELMTGTQAMLGVAIGSSEPG
jgi:hypothetical protein